MPALLIADDSPGKMAFLAALVKHAKWEGDVAFAGTTEQAMKVIDEKGIGYAFVDYYIPSANGPAVIRHLKKKNPAARVALVSSSDKAANQEEAKAAGAEACVCTSDQADMVQKALLDLLEEWKER